ncbi:MAG TPA: zinc-binding dehydrogenase [Kofleriaceae bacterium]|nr:zinc-binding dehydrogenase [Kofleriaceae bacterium]
MRRYLVHRHGGPEVLRLDDAPEPQPAAGQVRVATRAIGINFADLIQRTGHYPRQPPMPFTPGMEAAGVVDAVGEGAASELLGRRVMAVPIYGSHAEKFCLRADYVMELPEWASFEEGAAFPVMYLTAWYALHELGRARAGERVIITAAAGGVGTALLQLARHADLRVMAVVGAPEKGDLVRSLGADLVASYDSCAAEAARAWKKVDLVIDAVGGTVFRPLWRLLDLSGRYILYGFAEVGTARGISYLRGARGLISMGLLRPYQSFVTANLTLSGFNLSVVPDQVPLLRRSATQLIDLWRDKAIRPIVGERFSFDRLPDAHRFLASRRSTGRVVVTA